ncbi:MAG: isochorismatase family protein [Deltaproteobacteria bacterium]|nr:isochorismatase family protein [Deltaproteobacteria bacterium]
MPQGTLPLRAEPESIHVDWARSAVVIVDMQNAFVSAGGMFDLRGFDVSPNQKIIRPINRIKRAAGKKGIKIIYVVHILSPDLNEVGPDSSFWYKSVRTFREDPLWADKFLIRGTWGAEIVDDLKPADGDIIVEKPRFSAFYGTPFDLILKRHEIRHLFFVGCATNICVEASIRDAADRGYFPVLVSDATANNGPPFMQEATIFNVSLCFGWVTATDNLLEVLA